ncbi:MAG: tetratricopeptide repeat protein [Xanthomonadaceae bacterium]|jgi:Ca-activated chloride channel family protein|nr:tetratricopeptide repeat protein [Xanthomonadaceae bacterium]
MSEAWNNLHFLRPVWFWALAALPLLWWVGGLRRRRAAVWHRTVDPHLLPELLESAGASRINWVPLLRSLGFLLTVAALAGPSWRQVEQPLWRTEQPLVIALDLSSGMAATDLPPSRLLRAKGKIAALLRERSVGQVGLVVWADDAFTVAPLTDDIANVALFLDALSPSIMPVAGQRPDRAIAWSAKLLKQTGFARGEILLLTDRAGALATAAAAAARRQGYRVSVLGVGGGVAGLDTAGLRALAQAGGGGYAPISLNDSDLRSLDVLDAATVSAGEAAAGESGKVWQDQGYLLLPLLLLWVLPLFQRGATLPVVLLGFWLWQSAPPALAAEPGNWWRRVDQVWQQRLDQGVESYRKGDFAAAEQAFGSVDNAEGQYNLGNALARQGRYDDAITAYDHALKAQPGFADARHNRDLVEAARKSQSSLARNDSSQQPSSQQQDNRNNAGQQGSSDSSQSQESASQRDQSTDSSGSGEPRSQARPDSGNGDVSPSASRLQVQGVGDSQADRQSRNRTSQSSGASPQPDDQEQQAAADAEQRQRMQQAMQQNGETASQPGSARRHDAVERVESIEEREWRQAREAWLQRVPDDPGGLLKTKFRLEYERRRKTGND